MLSSRGRHPEGASRHKVLWKDEVREPRARLSDRDTGHGSECCLCWWRDVGPTCVQRPGLLTVGQLEGGALGKRS